MKANSRGSEPAARRLQAPPVCRQRRTIIVGVKRMFSDYDGPTGAFVATSEGMRPITDPHAIAALADAAMLTSLGASDSAAEFQRRLEDGRRRAQAAATA
jgi:hypothetical protein